MSIEQGDHIWYWDGRISSDLDIPRHEWFPGSTGPTDYKGHGKEIYNYVFYEEEIARGQPHMRNHGGSYAWLDNNPGNITGKAGGASYGAYQDKFNWHHFLIFPTWEAGYGGIAKYLSTPRYANLSLLDAFERYAPASDGNDPVRYANMVAESAGIPLSMTIGELDENQMGHVQNAITEMEGPIPGDIFRYDNPDSMTNVPSEIQALLQ